MNEGHELKVNSALETLPAPLRADPAMSALARTAAGALTDLLAQMDGLRIFTRIDQLPEEMLDILAYDFKVDWWDADYSVEEKRRILKDSWHVHRILGTKGAVEMAMDAIYPGTKVLEWFEYGGEPLGFKLKVDATFQGADPVKEQRLMDRLRTYKDLRARLDEIEYFDTGGSAGEYALTAHLGSELTDGAAAV